MPVEELQGTDRAQPQPAAPPAPLVRGPAALLGVDPSRHVGHVHDLEDGVARVVLQNDLLVPPVPDGRGGAGGAAAVPASEGDGGGHGRGGCPLDHPLREGGVREQVGADGQRRVGAEEPRTGAAGRLPASNAGGRDGGGRRRQGRAVRSSGGRHDGSSSREHPKLRRGGGHEGRDGGPSGGGAAFGGGRGRSAGGGGASAGGGRGAPRARRGRRRDGQGTSEAGPHAGSVRLSRFSAPVGAEGGRQDAFWRTLGEVGSKDILFLNPRWIREGDRKKYVPGQMRMLRLV